MVIGVAIGIPEPFRGELAAWRKRLGDPNADAIPPHVTLLPPTEIEAAELPVVVSHLAAIADIERPFTIHLRGSGTFRPVSAVVFVPLVEGISGCERLEAHVRSGPLSRDVRFNYHPHVTVGHDLPDDVLDAAFDELSDYEARFSVQSFQLFDQDGDGVWRPMREFFLLG